MNWIYTGVGKTSRVVVHGEVLHGKTASSRYGKRGFNLKWLVANVDPNATRIDGGDKHRYLLPLDDAMREAVMPLSLPYPKADPSTREKQAMAGSTGTAAVQRRPSRSILQTVSHGRKHPKRSRNGS